MAAGDEADSLAAALAALGADGVDEVLADHPGRRRVVRAGDACVKAFSSAERPAWWRELVGLRRIAESSDPALAPALVAWGQAPTDTPPRMRQGETRDAMALIAGPGWTATRWIESAVPPMSTVVDDADIHAALGPWLARLHAIPPEGLPAWSVSDRLHARLADPADTVPASLVRAVADLVEPLLATVVGGSFVHGDWGTANVLVDEAGQIVAVIDFEDAHVGDAAEDMKWQVLAGPDLPQLRPIAETYLAAGGRLGPNATERLVVHGAELCLDVAGWGLAGHTERAVATLDDLVSGRWPAWPD